MIDFIVGYLIFLFVLTVHECAHAWMADRCGDSTARLLGRMTLDPRPHIDLFGTVFIPLSPVIFAMGDAGGSVLARINFMGWAKPVPVNPLRVRPWRIGNILISLAGCLSGFLLALVAALFIKGMQFIFTPQFLSHLPLTDMLLRIGGIAIWLSLFNLLPVPPLDGYHIAAHLFRLDRWGGAAALESFGPWLLLMLINTPLPYAILSPMRGAVMNLLFGW
ncbi:MAG: site-2 protease family protein [Candidatus Aureabacteria bacterium]|nr:site-2 protease family protein [Candidatus Auribacterota bacterium]